MTAEVWSEIRRLRLVDKLPIAQIAEHLRLDRKTVRKALLQEVFQPRQSPRRPSLLDPYKTFIQQRLEKYPKLSAPRLLEELSAQGYPGGVSILKDYLREIRPSRVGAYLPLKFAPGESAQVDWASCGTISVGKHTRRLSCFVMVLSYSRLLYFEFTVSEQLEEFLRCHVNAFRFFGGHPPEIVYDNLKSVVLQRAAGEVQFNPRFMAFAGFYTFKPVPCRRRAPQEKGRVESGVGYLKNAFLMGREFGHFDQVNPAAFEWRDQVANRRLHGSTHQRPVDAFEEERSLLIPLPEKVYDTSVTVPVKATTTFRVHFESNTYSVPPAFAGRRLTLKATPTEVRVYDQAHLLVTHPRSFDRAGDFEKPEHARALLESRSRARRERSVADFLALGGPAENYLGGLVHAQIHLYHHLARILILVDTYGVHEVLQALRTALTYQAFGASYVENIIHQRRLQQAMPPPQPLNLADDPEILQARVSERDLNLYDRIWEDELDDENQTLDP